MKIPEEAQVSMWAERYADGEERHGLFYDDACALNEALHDANDLGLLKDIGDGRVSLGIKSQKTKIDDTPVELTREACIRPQDKAPTTYMALGVKHESQEKVTPTYFAISENGVAVNLEGPTDLPEDDPIADLLISSMQDSTKDLNKLIAKKKYEQAKALFDKQRAEEEAARRKRERRRKIGKVLALASGVTVAVAGAGIGGTAGYQAWVVAPQEAEQAHRAEYDAQNHTLPGEGVAISQEAFSTISPNDFSTIPKYGGDDKNLDYPRRVTLDNKTGCLNVNVDDNTPDRKLVAAISQDSPYQVGHITATAGDGKINVCYVGKLPSASNDPSIDVAVQLKKS